MDKAQIKKLVLTLCLLPIGILLLAWQFWPRTQTASLSATDAYYLDLDTGAIFTAPLDRSSAADATTRNAALAYVYSCGDCGNGQDRFPLIVETKNDEGVAQIAAVPRGGGKELQWLPVGSPPADVIEGMALKTRCPKGGTVQLCRP